MITKYFKAVQPSSDEVIHYICKIKPVQIIYPGKQNKK